MCVKGGGCGLPGRGTGVLPPCEESQRAQEPGRQEGGAVGQPSVDVEMPPPPAVPLGEQERRRWEEAREALRKAQMGLLKLRAPMVSESQLAPVVEGTVAAALGPVSGLPQVELRWSACSGSWR